MSNKIPARLTLTQGNVATFEAPQGTDTKRRFSMVAYTGAAMQAGIFGKVVVDLKGLNPNGDRKPILRQHDHDRIAGYSDTVTKGSQLVMAGTLSGKTEAGREVADLADEGFPWQASIGIEIQKLEQVKAGETRTVNGAEFAGPGVVVAQSLLNESSFVPLGADGATSGIVFAANDNTFVELPQHQEQPMTPTEFAAANPDAVKDWKNEGFTEGHKTATDELTARFNALSEKFSDRPDFVLAQFKLGHDVGKAGGDLAEIQAKELAELKKLNAELQAKAASGTGFSGVAVSFGGGAAAPASTDAPADPNDPKVVAAWEFDNDKATWKASTKERYVEVRSRELTGQFRMATR